jgi:hypothetical protein
MDTFDRDIPAYELSARKKHVAGRPLPIMPRSHCQEAAEVV